MGIEILVERLRTLTLKQRDELFAFHYKLGTFTEDEEIDIRRAVEGLSPITFEGRMLFGDHGRFEHRMDERAQRQKVIVILGMNRSGTSLLAQLLERMGVWFGENDDLVGPSPINTRGHYEYIPIVRVQQQILKNLFDCTELFKGRFPRDWHKDETVQLLYKEALSAHLKRVMEQAEQRDKTFGFKDPRTTRLLPLWQEIFSDLDDVKPIYLLTWRSPGAVYLSIHPGPVALPNKGAEDMHFQKVGIPSIPQSDIEEIWEYYMEDAWSLGGDLAAWFRFDEWFTPEGRREQMERLADAVSLPPLSDDDMREIIDPQMRHVICQ